MAERIFRDPEIEKRVTALHPLGQVGRPEEVADAVVWLCSEEASFITGHALPIDGGTGGTVRPTAQNQYSKLSAQNKFSTASSRRCEKILSRAREQADPRSSNQR